MASWGNPDNDQLDQDLVSSTSNKNILKVNDVNDGNDAKTAAHFINGSTNPSARAIVNEGVADFANDNEAAIVASGSSDSVIEGGNTANDITKKVMILLGNTLLTADNAANKADVALNVVNASTHADAKGLVVDGDVDLDGNVEIDGTLQVGNGADAGRIDAE
jgi:hypothetical protein